MFSLRNAIGDEIEVSRICPVPDYYLKVKGSIWVSIIRNHEIHKNGLKHNIHQYTMVKEIGRYYFIIFRITSSLCQRFLLYDKHFKNRESYSPYIPFLLYGCWYNMWTLQHYRQYITLKYCNRWYTLTKKLYLKIGDFVSNIFWKCSVLF